MYSFHSSPEEKKKLLFALSQHGIETTVDRMAKKKRIRDWIQESVIIEDDEEEEAEQDNDDGENVEPLNHRAPVAGHVSTVRAQETATQPKIPRKQIVSTVKSAENKHINPRTGQIQEGPSQMGNHESNGSAERIIKKSTTPPERMPRKSAKLVDVGSQTSNDSQKLRETMMNNNRATAIDDAYATVPLIAQNHAHHSYTQSTQTGPNDAIGLSTAFNSMTTTPKVELPPTNHRIEYRYRDRSQPRHAYNQRHNTNALIRPPISRSMHNFNNLVNDSGYGSLDKLRPIEPTMNLLSSPTLSKRSVIKTSIHDTTSGAANNDYIHINGLSHSQHESDSGGESPFGSNGFVNCADSVEVVQRRPKKSASMKDTVYDRNLYGRRKT